MTIKKFLFISLIFISILSLFFIRKKLEDIISNFYIHYNLKYTNKLDSINIYANSFQLKVNRYKNYKFTNKTAGLIIDSNNLKIFEQSNLIGLKTYFHLDSLFKNIYNDKFYESEPLKQLYKYRDNILALLIFNDQKNKYISIINCTKKFEIFRSKNLPTDIFLDYNGIGGGITEFNNDLLIAIGVPSAGYKNKISELAQNPNSPYGKVLIFKSDEIISKRSNIYAFKIFTMGHRNPQGLLNLHNTIYEVEHGPRGGDELNILEKGYNYGWPIYSYGNSYEGNIYNIPKDTLQFKSPIYSFIPSVATSDITACPNFISEKFIPYDCLLLSTLKAKSIFILIIDPINKKLVTQEQLNVGYRIREFLKEYKNTIIFSTDGYGVYKLDTLLNY